MSLYSLEFTIHENNSNTLNAIMAIGEIKYDDVVRLDNYVSKLPKKKHIAIYFNSPGGNLYGGMRLGKYFKLNGIKTVIQGDSICASACALAFLGGTDSNGNKWMSSTTTSSLGFHAFSKKNGNKYGSSDNIQNIVSEVLRYGQYVNAPMEIFIKQFSTPSSDIYWFSIKEELSLGIKVWDIKNNYFLDEKPTNKTSLLSSTEFIKRYFTNLKKIPYQQSWDKLSKRMQNKTSFHKYKDWWDKKVKNIFIKNIDSISKDMVKITLKYHLKDGKSICSIDTFILENINNKTLIKNQTYKKCF